MLWWYEGLDSHAKCVSGLFSWCRCRHLRFVDIFTCVRFQKLLKWCKLRNDPWKPLYYFMGCTWFRFVLTSGFSNNRYLKELYDAPHMKTIQCAVLEDVKNWRGENSEFVAFNKKHALAYTTTCIYTTFDNGVFLPLQGAPCSIQIYFNLRIAFLNVQFCNRRWLGKETIYVQNFSKAFVLLKIYYHSIVH